VHTLLLSNRAVANTGTICSLTAKRMNVIRRRHLSLGHIKLAYFESLTTISLRMLSHKYCRWITYNMGLNMSVVNFKVVISRNFLNQKSSKICRPTAKCDFNLKIYLTTGLYPPMIGSIQRSFKPTDRLEEAKIKIVDRVWTWY